MFDPAPGRYYRGLDQRNEWIRNGAVGGFIAAFPLSITTLFVAGFNEVAAGVAFVASIGLGGATGWVYSRAHYAGERYEYFRALETARIIGSAGEAPDEHQQAP